MKEYFTEGIILEREDAGEQDSRITLYTQTLGKVSAKATSARKITSKLSAHLEPLTVVHARLIKKNKFQIADVVRIRRLSESYLPIIRLLHMIVPEGEPDHVLWEYLQNKNVTLRGALMVLGFDPEGAECIVCGKTAELAFSPDNMGYICRSCIPRKNVSLARVSLFLL